MAYSKTNWKDGDVITAEKLNKLENGVKAADVLPAVTAADNGKLAGVSAGAWAAVTAPGGIYDVPITVTVDGSTLAASTTAHYADVVAAHTAGKLCRAVIDASAVGGDVNYAYPASRNTAEAEFGWSLVEYLATGLMWIQFYMDAEDAIHITTEPLTTPGS